MGHKAFALMSCAAAVPAAILCYVLVWNGFFQHAGEMNIKMLIMTAITLVFSAFIALIPGGIMIYGRPRKKKPAAVAPGKSGLAAAVPPEGSSSEASLAELDSSEGEMAATFESSQELSVFDSSGEAAVFDSDAEVAAEDDDLELDATTAFSTPAQGSDLELGDSDTLGDSDVPEFEEIEDEVILEEDEDEEPPSRKKKK